MKLDLVITENCCSCKHVEKLLRDYLFDKKSISFNVVFQQNYEAKIVIVPALLVDGKLFGYGDVDLRKLTEKIDTHIKLT